MDYTICSEVLEAAMKNKKYFRQLLSKFFDENEPIRVVINPTIAKIYKKIALSDERGSDRIVIWLEEMTENIQECWAFVDCKNKPIFIKTCKDSDDKKLIVSDKNNYHSGYEGLKPIDKNEAINEIRSPKNIFYIKGSRIINSILGDNSSLTVFKKNSTFRRFFTCFKRNK